MKRRDFLKWVGGVAAAMAAPAALAWEKILPKDQSPPSYAPPKYAPPIKPQTPGVSEEEERLEDWHERIEEMFEP